MKAFVIALAICIGISLLFALLATTSPVPEYPKMKQCTSTPDMNTEESLAPKTGASNSCEGIFWENSFEVSAYDSALVPFQALTETAEAFALISIAASVWVLKLPLPDFLKRGVNLPTPLRVAAIFAVIAGSTVFAQAALLDFSNTNPLVAVIAGSLPTPASNPSLYAVASLAARDLGLGFLARGWTDQIGGVGSSFSVIPFFSFVVSAFGVVAFRLNRGFQTALRDGVVWYGASTLALFEVGLRLFVPAATFQELSQVASVEVGNVPLVSNWLVLLVSTAVIVLGIEEAQHRKQVLDSPSAGEGENASPDSNPVRSLD